MSSYEEHRKLGHPQSAQNRDGVDDRLSETLFDVVVVGSGAAALSAATTAARDGASVVVLEAASGIGGTTAKSSGGFWIPRNRVMRERGFEDDRDGCLAHMARLSYPQHYERSAERHGLEQAEWDLIVNYYDNAVGAIEDLEATGDLDYMIMESFRGDNRGLPPWYATEEDGVTYGRLLAPTPLDESAARQSDHLAVFTSRDGGASASNKSAAAMRSQGATQGDGTDLVRQLLHAAKRYGATVVVEHHVLELVTDEDGAVVGVVAETPDGRVTVEARQGVVFGSGGMEHDEELRARFLRGPIVGTCGVSSNRGDFIRMAERIGADLANTSEAWWAELPLESCLKSFEQGDLISQIYGDASILVNAEGHRVVNEKLMYNERGKVHFVQDENGGYPNYLLFMVFDDAVVQDTTPWPSRWPVPYPDAIGPEVLTGATFADLGQAIGDRLTQLSEFTGGFLLKSGFAAQLERTVQVQRLRRHRQRRRLPTRRNDHRHLLHARHA
jgi:3-oxosteroid 1-dehydrogenase